MRIDVILESNNSPERVRELGKLAEDCGLGGVWVSNMNDAREPFINFVPLAQATEQVSIGPIAVSPFELHPLKMASSLLTFNELAGGRAQIVVGGGGGTATAMGAMRDRRVRAVRECLEILKQAGTGEPLQYQGEIYQVRYYNPSWVQAPAPRIYAGANGPMMLRMAAKYADAVMLSDSILEDVRWSRDIIDARLAKIGREPADFPLNNFWAWHVKESQEEAERESRIWLAVRGTIYPKYTVKYLEPDEAEIVNAHTQSFINAYHRKSPDIEGVPDDIIRKIVHRCTSACALADIDQEVERMRQFRDAGLTEIALRVYDNPAEAIRNIGEHIVPALRD